MKISYGITVCDEHEEILILLEFLKKHKDPIDEIVVVYDQNRVTPEVLMVLEENSEYISYYPFNFQQNFLENKNYLNTKCTGNYIFQLDSDETPTIYLMMHLKQILEENNVDLLITPRKNLVEGLTQEHIQKWRWNVNEHGWVNWPDCQKRIYRNNPKIQWTGHQVHGMVTGYNTYASLPLSEDWCIIHNKKIYRQEAQNNRYDKIEKGELK
jgi:hypothetical protein